MNLFTEIKWDNLELRGFLDDDHIRENSFTYRFLTDKLKVSKHSKQKRNLVDDECSEDESKDKGPMDGSRRKGRVDLDEPVGESDHKWQNKKHIAGLVGRLPFPKQSCLTKHEQATFIELHSKFFGNKRLTIGGNVSTEDQRLFAMYIELNNKVMAERAEFLSFLKGNWKIQSIKFNRLPKDVERYSVESWRHRIKARLPSYPRYYNRAKSIPLVCPGEKNDVQLIQGDLLLQLGSNPFIIHPRFKDRVQLPQDAVAVSKRYPPDGKQPDVDTTNTIHKLPVSEDANASQLAMAYAADVVISSAGLKAVANNHSDFGRPWDVPVVVRRYEPRAAGDAPRTVVYVDKPLPPRRPTVAGTNERYHKLAAKTLWCHPRHHSAFRFQPQRSSEGANNKLGTVDGEENATRSGKRRDSDSTGDESPDGLCVDEPEVDGRSGAAPRKRRRAADPVAVVDCRQEDKAEVKLETDVDATEGKVFAEPGPYANVSYRLWTMRREKGGREELSRHMMKQPTGTPDRELRVLVRNKLDGFVGAGRHNEVKAPVVVLPKLEHQSEYGAEKMTKTELTNEWLALKFRQGARLTRVRVNAETSEALLTETLTLDALTQSANRAHGPRFVSDLASTLYSVLNGLVGLAPGNYLLTHSAVMRAFAMLQKGNDEFGSFDLQQVYSRAETEEPTNEEAPWVEVDTSFTMPYHAVFGRVPGTFYPGYVARPPPAAPAKPTAKKVAGKKKKKNRTNNKRKAEQASKKAK